MAGATPCAMQPRQGCCLPRAAVLRPITPLPLEAAKLIIPEGWGGGGGVDRRSKGRRGSTGRKGGQLMACSGADCQSVLQQAEG
jgi:hypothetical protein